MCLILEGETNGLRRIIDADLREERRPEDAASLVVVHAHEVYAIDVHGNLEGLWQHGVVFIGILEERIITIISLNLS